MGRARKPAESQTRHNSKGEIQQRQFEQALVVTSSDDLREPPKELTTTAAKKEWRRVVPILLDMSELIGDLDQASLIGYCNARALYVRACAQLAKEELIIEGKENPLIAVQKKAAEEMRAFAGKCGLTIDSRLKLAAEKAKKVDNDISEEFGDI